MIALDEATEKLAASVRIRLDSRDVSKEKIAEIKTICRHHRGKSPVYITVDTGRGKVYTKADRNLSVNPDIEFCKKIKYLIGEQNFQLAR